MLRHKTRTFKKSPREGRLFFFLFKLEQVTVVFQGKALLWVVQLVYGREFGVFAADAIA